jgi:hypothetical protein
MKKLISMSLLALMALGMSGCDTTMANAPGNTTLGGAAVGGLTGAGIGALTGHGTKGALVGGLIGTAGGAVVGNQMERNRAMQQQMQSPYQAGLMPQGAPPPPAPRSY